MPLGRRSLSITASLGAVFLAYTLAVGQSQPSRDDFARSLPSTNLSADGTVDRSAMGMVPGLTLSRFPQIVVGARI